MNDIALKIEHLTRRFGSFTAVDDVSLEIKSGEVFAFLGPNGAGKSTTIKMMAGLLRPSSGNGWVSEFDIYRESEKIKLNIGYMSQKFSLYNDLTPSENIRFFGGIYGVSEKILDEKMENLYSSTAIGQGRNEITASLPLGLKQRLALECAMLHDPPILFLDEPTAGVDPMARRSFWDIIYEAAQRRTTVFLTTHYMDEAEHADRVAMIFSGRLRAVGTPSELKNSYAGGRIYQFKTDDLLSTLQTLEATSEVREATVFGSSLHMTLDKSSNLDSARNFLNKNNIEFNQLKDARPSLEDVFINLTGEEQ